MRGKGNRTDILKKFYNKGMTGRKSHLVKEAACIAGCSENTVMTFIYNQNKKNRITTDVKTVEVPEEIGSFQSFQQKYARTCKLYGRKYSNSDAAQMWKSFESTPKGKHIKRIITMKGATFFSKKECKVRNLVKEIKQVNALTFYARMTPCGKGLICTSPTLVAKVKKFLWEMDDYLASVRSILKKITEEDDDYIANVLTGHTKIKTVRKVCPRQFEKEEKQMLRDLLQADLFDSTSKSKICRQFNFAQQRKQSSKN